MSRVLADKAVEICQSLVDRAELGVHVHWDDCDMDYRRFWFYFQFPGIRHATPGGSVFRVSRAIRKGMSEARKALEKEYPDYNVTWSYQSSPSPRYSETDSGKPRFSHYGGNTWVYVMTLWGGPDGITIKL